MKKAIIVDIDGTLANCEDRVHFLKKTPKDWKSFHARVKFDTVNEWCKRIVEYFYDKREDDYGRKKCDIIFVSGRVFESYYETKQWLRKNNIEYDHIFMREKNDYRDDDIFKKEVYDKHIKGKYEILFAIDDRSRIVKMWREQGITCLQCAVGDF